MTKELSKKISNNKKKKNSVTRVSLLSEKRIPTPQTPYDNASAIRRHRSQESDSYTHPASTSDSTDLSSAQPEEEEEEEAISDRAEDNEDISQERHGRSSRSRNINSHGKKVVSSSSGRSHRSSARSRSGRSSKSRGGASQVDAGGFPTDPSRIQLDEDMMMLADGIHLDQNTKTLLAVYDAKTVEDFYLMGEYDLNHLLAKARASNRGLPPLQIRKVRILREWISEVIDDADVTKLPVWAKPTKPTSNLVPLDFRKRFQRDLPKLKKRLREKGDSIAEFFPWLSYLINVRDMMCGSAPRYSESK